MISLCDITPGWCIPGPSVSGLSSRLVWYRIACVLVCGVRCGMVWSTISLSCLCRVVHRSGHRAIDLANTHSVSQHVHVLSCYHIMTSSISLSLHPSSHRYALQPRHPTKRLKRRWMVPVIETQIPNSFGKFTPSKKFFGRAFKLVAKKFFYKFSEMCYNRLMDSQDDGYEYEPEVVALTAENANELMLAYFTVEPMVSWDAKGKMINVPCSVPTVAGFASRYNMAPSRFKAWVLPETLELCQAKFEHIVVTNGLGRGYDAGFASLTMKNLAGWAEKSEAVVTERKELAPEDLRLLEELGVRIATRTTDGLTTQTMSKLITQTGETI